MVLGRHPCCGCFFLFHFSFFFIFHFFFISFLPSLTFSFFCSFLFFPSNKLFFFKLLNSTHFEEKNARQSLLGCFCGEQNPQDLYTLPFELNEVPGLVEAGYKIPIEYNTNENFQIFWCNKWLFDTAIKQALSIASVLLIVIVNMLLKVIMKRLVNMEKPISQSQYSTSLMTKLTIFQFLNTALVTMLVNANLNDFDTGETDPTIGGVIFNGDYSDFTKGWHLQIGTALLLTMLINLSTPIIYYWFLPWLTTSLKVAKDRARCCCCCQHPLESKKITQGDYDAMFLGGAFNLEPRFAIVNMVTGVSLVFGASTPLLYPFAVIYLTIQFWGDKYVFVRTASIPERTDDSVAMAASMVLTPFVVFRLFMSCWMFSNTAIWQGVNLIDDVLQWVLVHVLGNTDTGLDSESLLQVLSCGTGTFGYIAIRAIMTVPHIFLLIIIIIIWLLVERLIAPTLGTCILGACPFLQNCCSGHSLKGEDDNEEFTELVKHAKISGAEEFDFAHLEAFMDEVAAELDENVMKKQLEKDLQTRKDSSHLLDVVEEDVVEEVEDVEEAEEVEEEEEHFRVANTKFEIVDTSEEEDDE